LFIRGLTALAAFRPQYLLTVLSYLHIPIFSYNLPIYLVVTFTLKKSMDQVLAWKSGLKVSLLPLGPSCPLQILLLSDLVGCGIPNAESDGRLAHFF
jgi:hypothetical protein